MNRFFNIFLIINVRILHLIVSSVRKTLYLPVEVEDLIDLSVEVMLVKIVDSLELIVSFFETVVVFLKMLMDLHLQK